MNLEDFGKAVLNRYKKYTTHELLPKGSLSFYIKYSHDKEIMLRHFLRNATKYWLNKERIQSLRTPLLIVSLKFLISTSKVKFINVF